MRQYLSSPEVLSQAWLDQTVIYLVLAILKVYFFSRGLVASISALGEASLPLCRRLELLASEIENSPKDISKMTSSILKILAANVHTLVTKMLKMSAAMAKGIISLLIELYLGTLTCLITAMVKGTLELVSNILSDITQFVQNAINSVLKEFNSALSGLSTLINGITSAVSAVESLFSSSNKSQVWIGIKRVNLTISTLRDIRIPSTWIGDIENLADEVPDFEEVLSNVTSLVTSPISYLKQSFSNSSFNFTLHETPMVENTTDLTVIPELKATIIRKSFINTTDGMCDDIEAIFAKAAADTRSMADNIILGLCVGTVLYAVVTCILAYLHQRKRTRLFATLSQLENPMEIGNSITNYDRGFMALFTRKWVPQAQWLFSYMTTPKIGNCVFLGSLGWLIVLLQFITLQQSSRILQQIQENGTMVTSETQAKLAKEFADYLDDAQNSLNLTVEEFNNSLFSSIHNTTEILRDRIDFFQNSVNNTINTVFGSSFLGKPFRAIIYCTVGRKIDSIEAGLQWIENNTEFEAPGIDKEYLTQSFANSSPNVTGLSQEISTSITSAVEHFIKIQKRSLWMEIYIATGFFSIWGIYLIIGLILIAFRTPHIQAAENRLSTQAISWPSQLREEAQQEYSYPYNDPYGAPYMAEYGKHGIMVSEPQTAYSGNNLAQQLQRRAIIPEVTETTHIHKADQSSRQLH